MLKKTEEIKIDNENGNKSESSSDSDDDDGTKFPDTQIKIQHFSGTK